VIDHQSGDQEQVTIEGKSVRDESEDHSRADAGPVKTVADDRLCCTNRLEDVLALTPDGFSLRLLFGVCQER
jgi:hypothetical protein